MSIESMRHLSNGAFKWYFRYRLPELHHFMEHPHDVQESWRERLLQAAAYTSFGRSYDFHNIETYREFADRIPIQDYESFRPLIHQMMLGQRDVLWPGKVTLFSKSSGTTGGKSKFLPVSEENLQQSHLKGGWDTMTFLYENKEDASVMEGRNLILPGSIAHFEDHPASIIGDVSALMINRLPLVGRPFYSPDIETALLPSWEEKIQKVLPIVVDQDIRMFGGVPTWMIVLFRRLLERTGKSNLKEIWPNLQAYIHGGVSFGPYKEQFKSLIQDDNFIFQEVFNASEGYFATQNEVGTGDMLLLLDNGVYHEFLPMEEWGKEHPRAIPLSEVVLGKTYAMVITTNSGLWRYNLGDTVTFTSIAPYKIKIAGRTKQFINAFGEELMVDNAEQALLRTCTATSASVADYTVAPMYFAGNQGKGGHEWAIEFETLPTSMDAFTVLLDEHLKSLNTDYEAKRFKGLAMNLPKVHALPKGTFHTWMQGKGKFGGQNKVPRLANHRDFMEEILQIIS